MSKKHRQRTKHGRTKTPNYLETLLGMKSTGPGVYHVEILHDDWCDQLNGKGPCNCEPIVRKPERSQ